MCQLVFLYLLPADLTKLCLVNSQLRTLVEPYLYASIQLTWDQPKGGRNPLYPHPITSLLRSLLRRPQLATYVRSISLIGSYAHNPTINIGPLKILVSDDELNEARTFVGRTTVAYRDTWLEGLQNGVMDAFIAVLLSQPLRLTSLTARGSFLCESQFIGLVLRSMIFERDAYDRGLRLDLRQLATVTLATFCDHFRLQNNKRNTADLLPILYLPSIRQFCASIDNPSTFAWPGAKPPSPSRLQSLVLYNIREPFLGQLLSVTDQIQFLHWQWYYYRLAYEKPFSTRTLDLTQITESISHVRESLTELVISALNQNDPDPLQLTIRGSMKGMVEFKKLKKLTVPFIFLVGTWSIDLTRRIDYCLPRSLEHLIITQDLVSNDECEWWGNGYDEPFSILQTWLKNYRASTPHLREVHVMISYADKYATQAQMLADLTDGAVKFLFLEDEYP